MIVELKRAFGLSLVLQGVDRLAVSDRVYLAVGQWPKQMKNVRKLCRRLGLGLMVVAAERADIVLDPAPYQPRLNKRKTGRLLGEHARRVGDPNRGGSTTRVPMMTAYRQEALRCAELLANNGPMKVAALRAHQSQIRDMEDLAERLRTRLALTAQQAGLPEGHLAEGFRVLDTA